MNIIEAGDERVSATIGQKLKTDRTYRRSVYTNSFSEGHTHLLRSTLTGVTAALTDMEWSCVEELSNRAVSGEEVRGAGIADLVRNGVLVETGTDDFRLYELAVSVLKTMSREGKGMKVYTILPTTGCNARCFYCYEAGMSVRVMKEETADSTADFIEKTRWQDEIKLLWFGGEPLAASRVIARICSRLNGRGIPFRSTLVTNGVMMTPELLNEAETDWHLKSAQVSVDGKGKEYESRKAYVNPIAHHYEAMMRAVGLMLERGIRVTLRCNYDGGNLEGLREFFDDVKRRFGGAEKLSVYLAMLFQEKYDDKCIGLYREAWKLNGYLRETGLNDHVKKRPYALKLNYCGADSGDKGIVIDPDGELYRCEHLPASQPVGSIFDPPVSFGDDENADLPVDEACKNCAFLPECTPFRKKCCPDWFAYCREFERIDAEESFRRMAGKIGQVSQIGMEEPG